ncbi:MAG TPA: hypothetical protein VGI60_06710 [Chthoniobacterales bacterium]|jgi:hypothetical protein
MKLASLALFLFLGAMSTSVRAQTPVLIVIQAATPAQAAIPAPPTASNVAESPGAIELLQTMQAANADVLKKQQAALATLDELQKAAEELKIFSKRG